MICPNCGAENDQGSAFCMDCGGALTPAIETPAPQPGQSATLQPERMPPSPMPANQMPQSPMPANQMPPFQQPMGMPVQPVYMARTTDGSCIAGMVLGIVALVIFWFPYISWVLGILAIIFGLVGMKTVQVNPGAKTGYGMGVAGLVTGILSIIASTAIFIVVLATYSR